MMSLLGRTTGNTSMRTPIRGERLVFRKLREKDSAIIFPEIDEELTRYWIGWEPAADTDALKLSIKETLGKIAKDKNLAEFVAFTKDNEFIGCCGIEMTPEKDYEINVWVKKSMQGKGYGLEIACAMVEHAKEKGLKQIIYSITEGNAASYGLLSKLEKIFSIRELRVCMMEKRGQQKEVTDYLIDLGEERKPL